MFEVVPFPPASGPKKTSLGRLFDSKNYDDDTKTRNPTGIVKPENKCMTAGCESSWSVIIAGVPNGTALHLCGKCAAERRARVDS